MLHFHNANNKDVCVFLMQISAPGGPSTLLIPLPLPGSETTLAKDTPSSGRGDLQVRICADSVCSLQVSFTSSDCCPCRI